MKFYYVFVFNAPRDGSAPVLLDDGGFVGPAGGRPSRVERSTVGPFVSQVADRLRKGGYNGEDLLFVVAATPDASTPWSYGSQTSFPQVSVP